MFAEDCGYLDSHMVKCSRNCERNFIVHNKERELSVCFQGSRSNLDIPPLSMVREYAFRIQYLYRKFNQTLLRQLLSIDVAMAENSLLFVSLSASRRRKAYYHWRNERRKTTSKVRNFGLRLKGFFRWRLCTQLSLTITTVSACDI